MFNSIYKTLCLIHDATPLSCMSALALVDIQMAECWRSSSKVDKHSPAAEGPEVRSVRMVRLIKRSTLLPRPKQRAKTEGQSFIWSFQLFYSQSSQVTIQRLLEKTSHMQCLQLPLASVRHTFKSNTDLHRSLTIIMHGSLEYMLYTQPTFSQSLFAWHQWFSASLGSLSNYKIPNHFMTNYYLKIGLHQMKKYLKVNNHNLILQYFELRSFFIY